MRNILALSVFVLLISVTGFAQAPESKAANAADVATTDAVINAAYDVISGAAGKQRDWDRLRSLCVPEVRFVVAAKPASEKPVHSLTLDEYISGADKYFAKEGFYERGVANHGEVYDRMAQVFSTYESRHDIKDTKPFQRGINSFQLVNDGKRWWIVDIFWEAETPEAQIPQKYLK
jgi:hypothetical protein